MVMMARVGHIRTRIMPPAMVGKMPLAAWLTAAGVAFIAVGSCWLAGAHSSWVLTQDSADTIADQQIGRTSIPQFDIQMYQDLVRALEIDHRLIDVDPLEPSVPMWEQAAQSAIASGNSLDLVAYLREEVAATTRNATFALLTLHANNQSNAALVLKLRKAATKLWIRLDWFKIRRAIKHTPSEMYTVRLHLANIPLEEALLITLGDVDLSAGVLEPSSKSPSPDHSPTLRFADWVDGTILTKYLLKLDLDPLFEDEIVQRLIWGQLLVSLFTACYAVAVERLAPIDFTCWQLRFYRASCLASSLLHCVFLAWIFDALSIRAVFPLAMAAALLYFVTFNVTNLLILLEPDPTVSGDSYEQSRRARYY